MNILRFCFRYAIALLALNGLIFSLVPLIESDIDVPFDGIAHEMTERTQVTRYGK